MNKWTAITGVSITQCAAHLIQSSDVYRWLVYTRSTTASLPVQQDNNHCTSGRSGGSSGTPTDSSKLQLLSFHLLSYIHCYSVLFYYVLKTVTYLVSSPFWVILHETIHNRSPHLIVHNYSKSKFQFEINNIYITVPTTRWICAGWKPIKVTTETYAVAGLPTGKRLHAILLICNLQRLGLIYNCIHWK